MGLWDSVKSALKIGNPGAGNYADIGTDGTIRLRGEATCWRDMVFDVFGQRLNSTAGKVDYDFDENAIVFSPSGSISTAADRVGGNQEINHEMLVGNSITFKPHIHWWQPVASGAVGAIVFTLRYRLQRNNTEKTSSWTTITCEAGSGGDDLFDFTGEADGSYCQISRFDDITVTCGISDTFQVQMTRTDSVSGDVSVFFIDIHGQVDSFGSEAEITKAA